MTASDEKRLIFVFVFKRAFFHTKSSDISTTNILELEEQIVSGPITDL